MYDGWDYSELCKALNIPDLDPLWIDDFKWIKYYLLRVLSRSGSRVQKKTAKEIREYCYALGSNCEHDAFRDLWIFIAKQEDDYVVLTIFMEMGGYAWC